MSKQEKQGKWRFEKKMRLSSPLRGPRPSRGRPGTKELRLPHPHRVFKITDRMHCFYPIPQPSRSFQSFPPTPIRAIITPTHHNPREASHPCPLLKSFSTSFNASLTPATNTTLVVTTIYGRTCSIHVLNRTATIGRHYERARPVRHHQALLK